jgi:putative PIN family toxin of toxin-antitoxin system
VGEPRSPPRVVLDTNLVLSCLALSTGVFGGGRPGALRRAWQQDRIAPLIATPTAAELLRTLGYPKFKLSAAEQEELLADYLPWCETVTIPNPPPATPLCRDPFDQPFLQLAIVGKAQYLVTGDADLLTLAPEFGPRIVTAAQLLETLA